MTSTEKSATEPPPRKGGRLRWLFPRVVLTGAALFLLSIIFPVLDRLGSAFGTYTLLSFIIVLVVYGVKTVRWMTRRLLWRVRRRLVITYLFVGLTPIVLLGLFGLLSAFAGSSQAMARIAAVQILSLENATLVHARSIARELLRLPPDTRAIQAWLDERATFLQSVTPGARLTAWVAPAGATEAEIGHTRPPAFLAPRPLPDEKNTSAAALQQPLPRWLQGRQEWDGIAYDQETKAKGGGWSSPRVGAVARQSADGRVAVVHVEVPLGAAWVDHVRDVSEILLYPWNIETQVKENQVSLSFGDPVSTADGGKGDQATVGGANREPPFLYPIVLNGTDWATGEERPHSSFALRWSWAEASRQILGGGEFGRVLRLGFVAVGTSFIVLEVLAVLAAAWMTRAVTGTVHELHHATEFINRGEFDHRARVRSHDQLGELADAFNKMSGNIELLLQERVERERLEREVEIAADVQAQLFPRDVPQLQRVEVSAECRAARGVAGDYYDYVLVSPGIMVFGLGDVSGKGISASLVMSNLQASFRAQTTLLTDTTTSVTHLAAAGGVDPGFSLWGRRLADARDGAITRMVTSINQQLCKSTEANRFATLFLGLYEEQTGVLRYVNAGHNPAVLIRPDGTFERLSQGGMMVGSFDWAPYEEARATLEAGGVLVIFSDGLSEARNREGEEYGEERLARFAVEHRDLGSIDLRREMFDDIERWSDGQERGDDQTLVILKALSAPVAPPEA